MKLRTTLTARGKSGTNTISFNARKRGFAAGSYRLTVRATDPRASARPRFRALPGYGPRGARAGSAAFARAIGGLAVFARRS